jgi:hypothetical protein
MMIQKTNIDYISSKSVRIEDLSLDKEVWV